MDNADMFFSHISYLMFYCLAALGVAMLGAIASRLKRIANILEGKTEVCGACGEPTFMHADGKCPDC